MFAGRSIKEAFLPPYEIPEIARQIFELGCRSLPLITASGFAVGLVLSMHTRASLARFGAEALIPAGLGIALVRETGPLTAGLLLSGRIGAGIGAEIGAMKVTEQIDALEVAGRGLVSLPRRHPGRGLCDRLPDPDHRDELHGHVRRIRCRDGHHRRAAPHVLQPGVLPDQFSDLMPATLKTCVFGFIIATVSSYLGMNTSRGTEGVGQASTRSVVYSSILLILANVVLVRLTFFFYPA